MATGSQQIHEMAKARGTKLIAWRMGGWRGRIGSQM
jgi:hypothetical protein